LLILQAFFVGTNIQLDFSLITHNVKVALSP
jgi:hypothetical protein